MKVWFKHTKFCFLLNIIVLAEEYLSTRMASVEPGQFTPVEHLPLRLRSICSVGRGEWVLVTREGAPVCDSYIFGVQVHVRWQEVHDK